MATIGPFSKGMNNLAQDHDIPKGTREAPGAACRNAVNVDFSNSGKARRRKGGVKVYSGLFPKGGFSCPVGSFFVEGGWLRSFDGTTATALCPVLGSTFTYHYRDGVVYFSDGLVCKKIVDGVAYNWGMTPPSAPVLSSTSGSYGPGKYLAAACFVDSDGVESGASQIVSVDAGADSGIVFGGLALTDDPQVAALRLYLSTPDGAELYHVADVEPGSAPYTVSAGRYDDSNVLEMAFVSPPPAGRIIRTHNGRKFVADAFGNVWYSDPFQPDHFRLGENFLSFPEPVDIMEPVAGGVFFAYGNKTEFHSGDVEDGFTVIPKFEYGGVFGTGRQVPNSENVMWQSQRGAILGGADGSVRNLVEEQVAPDTGDSGATIIREIDGLKQFIAVINNPVPPKIAATSWIEAEVIRRSS